SNRFPVNAGPSQTVIYYALPVSRPIWTL
ncbi:MAG: hypothetical protein QOH57_688, partial [Mycobacterium sp.]|nr:hypothetical protein [Mycobacterium sp.]